MSDTPGPGGDGIRILIVEDSPTQASILMNALQEFGFVLSVASNGEQALALVRKDPPDVIVSDIVMPVMDSYELCRRLKEDASLRGIPVILLTALSDSRDLVYALASGADNFITKPYKSEYLAARIRAIAAAAKNYEPAGDTPVPLEVTYDGKALSFSRSRHQIVDFLVSAYDAAVIQHQDLLKAQEDLRSSNEHLSDLNQLISICNQPMQMEDLAAAFLKKTLTLLDFDMGALFYISGNGAVASPAAYQESRPMRQVFLSLVREIDPAALPYSDVFCKGEPKFLRHGNTWPLDERSMAAMESAGLMSLAMVPVRSVAGVAGALFLGSCRDHEFPALERETLGSLGREIGAAVQKAQLQQRLAEANSEANLYLNIITHDISNVHTGMLGYAELMKGDDQRDVRNYVDIINKGINQSIGIIRNVSTIRKLHEKKVELRPVNLHAVIKGEIQNFPHTAIVYNGSPVSVSADDLIGQVIANLIGNSAKFCGKDARIAIDVSAHGDMIEVTVSDNGPGIMDAMKTQVFDRFKKGSGSRSGKGLGLYISRKLVESYGGRIWAGDRVAGDPSQGAAIHFMLRKA